MLPRLFKHRRGRRYRSWRYVLDVLAALLGFGALLALLLFAVDKATPPPPEPVRTAAPAATWNVESHASTASAPENQNTVPAGPAAPLEIAAKEITAKERTSRALPEPAPQPPARDAARSGRPAQPRPDVAQARATATREPAAQEVRRRPTPRRESTSQQAKQVRREPSRRETAEETSQTVDAADDFSVRWHRAGE